MAIAARAFLTLFVFFHLIPAAAGDQAGADKTGREIDVFDTAVRYPAPSWQDKPRQGASEINRREEDASFVLEQIPKGDTFEDWSKLYAVHGQLAPSLEFPTYVNRSVGVFLRVCGKENFKFKPLQKAESTFLILIMCEDSPNGKDLAGYGPGVGEITLMAMARPYDTFIKVYHHWRGESFSTADKSSWPVTPDKLNMMMARFKNIEYSRAR
ncbi:MAG: hypothetical protein ACFE0S_16350 [Rhodospirillales bacterium]